MPVTVWNKLSLILTKYVDETAYLCIFSGLKNDHLSETFHLKHQIDGNYFPCRYIKISKYLI